MAHALGNLITSHVEARQQCLSKLERKDCDFGNNSQAMQATLETNCKTTYVRGCVLLQSTGCHQLLQSVDVVLP